MGADLQDLQTRPEEGHHAWHPGKSEFVRSQTEPGRDTWLALGPLVDAVVPAAVWPVPAAAAVIVFAAATRLGPAIFLGGWIPVKKWIGPSLIVITVSASAVWIWDSLVDRGAAIEFRSGVVDAVENPILFLLAASGAAFLNAVVEESLWQGVLLRTVKGQGISAVASVAIVASSFGVTHYNGLPGGPSGIFLATVFGGIMGILYFRFRSLWPLVITHFVIDLILFTLVL